MIIKAEQKFIRTSPRKLRLVADSVRKLAVTAAFEQLQALHKYAALPLKKTLRQAQANAVNNHHLDPATLTIKEIQISEGPTYKRWQPVSRGRAHSIFKRTSHIRIVLEAKDENPKPQIRNPKQTPKLKEAKQKPHDTIESSSKAKTKTIRKPSSQNKK